MHLTETQFFEKASSEYGLDISKYRHAQNTSGLFSLDDVSEEENADFLLSPVLSVGDTTILYGGKGVGKTVWAMAIAFAVAQGGTLFGPIKAPHSFNTLYLDGEMGERDLNKRIITTKKCFNVKTKAKLPILFKSDRLDLYKPEERQKVNDYIANAKMPNRKGVEFLVLDNLTSMIGGSDTAQGWNDFYSWVMELKAQNITVLIVFHANADDGLRGSKMKSINIDNMILLKKRIQTKGEEPQQEDRSIINCQFEFKNLRNNPYPESYTSWNVSFNIKTNHLSMDNKDEYLKRYLDSACERFSDSQVADIFGKTPRWVNNLRSKYGIKKYKSN